MAAVKKNRTIDHSPEEKPDGPDVQSPERAWLWLAWSCRRAITETREGRDSEIERQECSAGHVRDRETEVSEVRSDCLRFL